MVRYTRTSRHIAIICNTSSGRAGIICAHFLLGIMASSRECLAAIHKIVSNLYEEVGSLTFVAKKILDCRFAKSFTQRIKYMITDTGFEPVN